MLLCKTSAADKQGLTISNLIKISPTVFELQNRNLFYLTILKSVRVPSGFNQN
jgi:hypothetical protein